MNTQRMAFALAAAAGLFAASQSCAHSPMESDVVAGCTAEGEALQQGADEQALAAQQRCNEIDIREKFASWDADRSGNLSKSELPRGHELVTAFDDVDLDDDGTLSLAEVIEHDVETEPVE